MVIKCQHFRDKQQFDAKLMFDKDLKITKAGKTFKMYDAIQEANVDTDIYQVALKYGMRGAEKECAQTYMRNNMMQLEEDMQEFMDLRNVLDRKIAADNMWSDLPIEIKKEFNNNVNEFMDNGQEWLQRKSAEFQKWKEAQNLQAKTQDQLIRGEQRNEQK